MRCSSAYTPTGSCADATSAPAAGHHPARGKPLPPGAEWSDTGERIWRRAVRDVYVVRQDQLATAGEFEGHEHGGTGISMIFVDAEPGAGPSLHRHDYDEVFVVQEGRATMTAGGRELEVSAGD